MDEYIEIVRTQGHILGGDFFHKASVKGPANYLALLVQRATMTGTVVSDYYDHAGEAAMTFKVT